MDCKNFVFSEKNNLHVYNFIRFTESPLNSLDKGVSDFFAGVLLDEIYQFQRNAHIYLFICISVKKLKLSSLPDGGNYVYNVASNAAYWQTSVAYVL